MFKKNTAAFGAGVGDGNWGYIFNFQFKFSGAGRPCAHDFGNRGYHGFTGTD